MERALFDVYLRKCSFVPIVSSGRKIWLQIIMLRQKNRRCHRRRRRQSPLAAFKGVLLHIAAIICIYSFTAQLILLYVSKCVCVCFFFHYDCPRKNRKCAIIKQLSSCIYCKILYCWARGGGGGDVGWIYNVRRGFTIRPHYYNIISCARCRQTMTRYNNDDIVPLWSNEILRGFSCLLSIDKSHSDGIKCHGTRSSNYTYRWSA